MKTLCLLPLLAVLVLPVQNTPTSPPDGSPIAVLSFKWSKSRQAADASASDKPVPSRAVSPADKNLERNARANDPAGKRDPNADTLDARGQALEAITQSANKNDKTVDRFTYQVKLHNTSKQTVEVVFWEYEFIDAANPGNVTRRQFLCGVKIKPDKDKELQAFEMSGPGETVNAASPATSLQEKVVINRVEFADGKSWMRKDWNANEIKAAYQRAMGTPWSPNEMCRAL
ncbi:MAG TPA: hypothetical protein VJV21_09345 [Pyrinomonadaceae bacterium]|nr:hypothetical protein [Pyrinomonadaceae bacterium]